MRLTDDLKSAKWIYAKGILFVVIAITAGGLLIARAPRLDVVALLLVCVWSTCRAYYFAFYVIEHYVDSNYRFSGLFDFAKYALMPRLGPKGRLPNDRSQTEQQGPEQRGSEQRGSAPDADSD